MRGSHGAGGRSALIYIRLSACYVSVTAARLTTGCSGPWGTTWLASVANDNRVYVYDASMLIWMILVFP